MVTGGQFCKRLVVGDGRIAGESLAEAAEEGQAFLEAAQEVQCQCLGE